MTGTVPTFWCEKVQHIRGDALLTWCILGTSDTWHCPDNCFSRMGELRNLSYVGQTLLVVPSELT